MEILKYNEEKIIIHADKENLCFDIYVTGIAPHVFYTISKNGPIYMSEEEVLNKIRYNKKNLVIDEIIHIVKIFGNYVLQFTVKDVAHITGKSEHAIKSYCHRYGNVGQKSDPANPKSSWMLNAKDIKFIISQTSKVGSLNG